MRSTRSPTGASPSSTCDRRQGLAVGRAGDGSHDRRPRRVGLGEGALIGTLFALLFGIFFNGPDFGYLLMYSVVTGGLFGVTIGLIEYAVDSDGRRDFVSETSVSADRYEVQADDEVAADARSSLASTPRS